MSLIRRGHCRYYILWWFKVPLWTWLFKPYNYYIAFGTAVIGDVGLQIGTDSLGTLANGTISGGGSGGLLFA